ncbi:MAG: alkaline phosphatase family protein [Verrucomicrobiia bacterium]
MKTALAGRMGAALSAGMVATSSLFAQATNQLPTGKNITQPPLGVQQEVGSLPMNMVASPDTKFALVSDMGTHQALWSIRTSDGTGVSHMDFPNAKPNKEANGLYYGLAFGMDDTLYAAQGNNSSIIALSLSADGVLATNRILTTKNGDFTCGLATDAHGHLYVANNDSDAFATPSSVAIYNAADGTEVGRFVFSNEVANTPNFPLAVAALSDGSKVFVSSQRDSAVYVLSATNPATPALLASIPTGSHPAALLLNKSQSVLYVANAHSDTISVISTADDKITDTLLLRPDRLQKIAGSTPLGLTLSRDERTLYVALADMNAVGVVSVNDKGRKLELKGYIPAGWYPTSVVVSGDGSKLLVANAKGTRPRNPNPGYVLSHTRRDAGYSINLISGNVSTIAIPTDAQLRRFTDEVFANNGPDNGGRVMAEHELDKIGLKAGKIKHVIYIIKENRTYDQVLGDVAAGNGDASLTLFGEKITPNQHALVKRFVLLDNFYDCGEVSGDGWPWSTQGMANEYVTRNVPYQYSRRGRKVDYEGQNDDYLTGGFPAKSPDGVTLSDVLSNGAPTVPDVAEAPGGHIWDTAQGAKLAYRNYGFHYSFGVTTNGETVVPDNYPASKGLQPGGRDLDGASDYDFRRFDLDYPDSDAPRKYGCSYKVTEFGKYKMPSRFSEWNREFQMMLAKDPTGGSVPDFMTVRFPHDHTQGFASGKFAPEAEVADNDYAVGQLVEAVSKSPIWESTAIFIIEDDAQDGPDHVDCHRSSCYVVSPWIKEHSIDHRFYNTDSALKTMELLMGLSPLSQYDAIANPILDFDTQPRNRDPYTAILPAKEIIGKMNPEKKAASLFDPMSDLMARSDKMDFDHPDKAPAYELNEVLWKGIKGVYSTMPEPRHILALTKDGKRQAHDSDDD